MEINFIGNKLVLTFCKRNLTPIQKQNIKESFELWFNKDDSQLKAWNDKMVRSKKLVDRN